MNWNLILKLGCLALELFSISRVFTDTVCARCFSALCELLVLLLWRKHIHLRKIVDHRLEWGDYFLVARPTFTDIP